MRDYVIINGGGINKEEAQDDLRAEVLKLMGDRWQPLGGAVYLGTRKKGGYTYHVFCQTLVLPFEE